MGILRIILIIITAILIIACGTIDVEHYKERFIINALLLMYLVYLLFT